MPNPPQIIPAEAWKPNQKVTLRKLDRGIRVTAAQDRSTPGVVCEVSVEPRRSYTLDLHAVANCKVHVSLPDDKSRVDGRAVLPYRPETVSFKFRARDANTVRLAILFPSTSRGPDGSPLSRSFDLLSASLTQQPRISGTIASLATMPSRQDKLPLAITSMRNQVDHIFVHLNEFDEVPLILNSPDITVTRSQQFSNLKDTGKFLALRDMEDDTIVFTIDDDIIYPSNYVSHMRDCLRRFDDKVVAGVHGVSYGPRPRGFFDRLGLHFRRDLPFDVPVSCLGTGTTAFKLGTLRPEVSEFTQHGMADLFFAGLAKTAGVPMIAVNRPAEWLIEAAPDDGSEDTLYHQTRRDNTPHTAVLSDYGPWGYSAIVEAFERHWRSLKKTPLHPAARQFVGFMIWMENGAETPCPDIEMTPEIIRLAEHLKMPALLREIIYS